MRPWGTTSRHPCNEHTTLLSQMGHLWLIVGTMHSSEIRRCSKRQLWAARVANLAGLEGFLLQVTRVGCWEHLHSAVSRA